MRCEIINYLLFISLVMILPILYFLFTPHADVEGYSLLQKIKKKKFPLLFVWLLFSFGYYSNFNNVEKLNQDNIMTYKSSFELHDIAIHPIEKTYDGIIFVKDSKVLYRCFIYPIQPAKLQHLAEKGYSFIKKCNSDTIICYRENDTICFFIKQSIE